MSDNRGVNAAGTAMAVYIWLKIIMTCLVLLGMAGCVALFLSQP